jgi:hypothetical protein
MEASEPVVDARALLAQAQKKPVGDTVERADVLAYDLGALVAFDPSPVDEAAFKADPETWLGDCARDCTQLLFNRLWSTLDMQAGGSKATIALPPPTTPIPREKPLPKPPAPTRWEKFAAQKGIVKKKRDRMTYDETQQKWMPRYGYKRADGDEAEWVLPAKPTDQPGSDPFEQKAQQKKEQRNKQLFNQERNRRAAKRSGGTGGGIGVAAAAIGVPELRAAAPSKDQRLKQADSALVRAHAPPSASQLTGSARDACSRASHTGCPRTTAHAPPRARPRSSRARSTRPKSRPPRSASLTASSPTSRARRAG